MSGLFTRNKGRRGQTEALNLLRERDWIVADLTAGAATEDGLCVCPDGYTWAVEIKNTVSITGSHLRQAKEQARARGSKVRWMLMNKIAGTSSWLVRRQGMRPVVWHVGIEPETEQREACAQ